jgi:LuxR family transcriptional regulator, maltose regulon positive regulatory protein
VAVAGVGRSTVQDELAFIEARLVNARIAAARHSRYEAQVAAHEAFDAATPNLLARPFLMTPGIEEVLQGVCAMTTNSEIADDLYVSVNTIKAHLKGIYRTLGVTGRRDAVRRARESGLLR